MTYLHDKEIVHGKLTTTNIYIEPNMQVKISLIDEHEMPLMMNSCDNDELLPVKSGFARFDVASLTYLSPELIKTITIGDNRRRNNHNNNNIQNGIQHNELPSTTYCHLDTSKLTRMSDVFAFGTILFELFEEKSPFSSECHTTMRGPIRNENHIDDEQQEQNIYGETLISSAAQIIYQIGSGKIADFNLKKSAESRPAKAITDINERISNLIAACWSCQISSRPLFKQLHFTR